ncbi:MAG TPA: MerR family transcriptional regulator [Bacteroidales bacterium]|nr:MerR family transcriptional regulator [Bacteroidales bacterium]HPS18330.1 MerR family transcriptional regulator [Bacteroidales bacterium]
MPYKEKEIEKVYYSIGEVAKIFNVNTSLIRFWEKEFDIIRPFKNKKGDRLFTQTDIENFREIFRLVKEQGFTLQGAKEKLKQNKGDITGNTDIVKTLENIKDFLLEIKNEL